MSFFILDVHINILKNSLLLRRQLFQCSTNPMTKVNVITLLNKYDLAHSLTLLHNRFLITDMLLQNNFKFAKGYKTY